MSPNTNEVFNQMAESYDEDFTESAIGKLQRKRVHRYLDKILSSNRGKRILELNCGTGEDALHMASLSHYVLATDYSDSMIKLAHEKSKKGSNFECSILDMSKSFDLENEYDLVFSNFGGLNCLSSDELKVLSNSVKNSLVTNGTLVAVIMGRKCIWEKMYYRFKNDSKNRKRRNSTDPIPIELNHSVLNIWYYSPSEIVNIFKTNFKVDFIKPIGFSIPPSYLNTWFKKHKWLLNIISLPEKLGIIPSSLSDYADHFYIQLTKKEYS